MPKAAKAAKATKATKAVIPLPDSTPTFEPRVRTSANPSNRAFIVESLVLLLFLAASVAIVLQLFVAASQASSNAHALSMSEHLANNMAEQFGADPQPRYETRYFTADGIQLPGPPTASFAVDCQVLSETATAGTLQRATVTVTDLRDVPIEPYVLDTTRYVSSRTTVGTPDVQANMAGEGAGGTEEEAADAAQGADAAGAAAEGAAEEAAAEEGANAAADGAVDTAGGAA